jgi:hypothetical protein
MACFELGFLLCVARETLSDRTAFLLRSVFKTGGADGPSDDLGFNAASIWVLDCTFFLVDFAVVGIEASSLFEDDFLLGAALFGGWTLSVKLYPSASSFSLQRSGSFSENITLFVAALET